MAAPLTTVPLPMMPKTPSAARFVTVIAADERSALKVVSPESCERSLEVKALVTALTFNTSIPLIDAAGSAAAAAEFVKLSVSIPAPPLIASAAVKVVSAALNTSLPAVPATNSAPVVSVKYCII